MWHHTPVEPLYLAKDLTPSLKMSNTLIATDRSDSDSTQIQLEAKSTKVETINWYLSYLSSYYLC